MGSIFQTSFGWRAHPVFRWVSNGPVFGVHTETFRGGIRGIVILEVLRNIERELGRRIPVLDFFDLIVGTRLVLSLFHISKSAPFDSEYWY